MIKIGEFAVTPEQERLDENGRKVREAGQVLSTARAVTGRRCSWS